MACIDEDACVRDAVEGPSFDEDRFYYYDQDPNFAQWVLSARRMQCAFATTIGQTGCFVYEPDERNYLTERIRLMLYGIKPGNEAYTREETRDAIKIKQKIVKIFGGNKATVRINVAYLSSFTFVNKEFTATEIPVFVMIFEDRPCQYMDTMRNVFKSVNEIVRSIGTRFKGGIIYPEGLSHKATDTGKARDVNLVYTDSEAVSLPNRISDAFVTVLDFSGMVLGVVSVAISLPISVYAVISKKLVIIMSNLGKTAKVIQLASTAIAIANIQLERCFREGRFVDAGGKVVFLIALALLSKNQVRRLRLNAMTSPEDITEMYGAWFKTTFYTLRISTTFTTCVSIAQALYAMFKKEKWTFQDLVDLSQTLFSLYNVVVSPHTIEAILASDQMKIMIEMEDRLVSNLEHLTSQESIMQGLELAENVHRKVIKISDSDNFYHRTDRLVAENQTRNNRQEDHMNVNQPQVPSTDE